MVDHPLLRRKPQRQRTAEEWRLIFKQWQRSGLSKSRYCKLESITPSCFARWYKRLMSGAKPNDLSAPSVLSSKSATSLEDALMSQFIPVGIGGVKHEGDLKLDITLARGHRICIERAPWVQVVEFLTSAVRC